ncbi:hypothetical protein D3C87_1687190 [compost metagenome]
MLAFFGQLHAAGGPVQECDAQVFFQALQAPTDARGCLAEHFGGGAQGACIYDSKEQPQGIRVQGHLLGARGRLFLDFIGVVLGGGGVLVDCREVGS